MNINELLGVKEGEKPLEKLAIGGGFCGIFRTIACIGDSLSSGEFESLDEDGKGWHDYFEYSWVQYMAHNIGATVHNFSRGGMTAIVSQSCQGSGTCGLRRRRISLRWA